MNPLDSFTVERLEQLADETMICKMSWEEEKALGKIALAAKQAEPDYYIVRTDTIDAWGPETALDVYDNQLDASKCKDDHGGEIIPAYATPPATQLPDGLVMVPIDPTEAMLDEFDSIIDFGAEDSVDAWRRLIAAAPKPE